jgi:pheromone shutdown protein TraB
VGCVGLIFYIIGVDVLHTVFIANFQWYKIVQWIKFMGIVGAVGCIYQFIRYYSSLPSIVIDYLTMVCAGMAGGIYFLSVFLRGF